MSGRKPARDFDAISITYNPPGVRKEKVKERAVSRAKPTARVHPYAELRAASAFSFLDGSSLPEDLVDVAAGLDLPAMALVDRNGVYGAPRFYAAARKAGVRALVGSELVLDDSARLTVLVESHIGYRNLCRLITAGAANHPKGEARFSWEQIEQHAEGLRCLTRADEVTLHRISGIFKGRTHVELQRHFLRDAEHDNVRLIDLARRMRLPLVATNGVRYARSREKELHDILTCIREGRNVDTAGRLLGVNRERYIKGPAEMAALFADLPEAIDGAWTLANTLDFTLADLGYQFPDYPLPPGETNDSYLRKITWNAAMVRFRPLTAKAQMQIEKELNMIQKLDLAGYFLIVWDIVQFCKRENILVQGRGSAANSAVCYALGITAVDPVSMELLFERFLSEERGEWPDIDLDLPSGDQREKVIQHVYAKYGKHGAAMTANVITYRDRSAAREVGKALGFSLEQCDKLSKTVSSWNFGEIRERMDNLPRELAKSGFDSEDLRVRHFIRLSMLIQNLPRHLGQHSGGMVLAKGRLDEIVPLEPASMPGRVVIQWDKDDCADLGLIKVDLLGLGMLAAIEEAIPLIRDHEKTEVDLAHLPQNDPLVYKALNEADTIGMFQVESRAQMASLPRNAPQHFYDIVVQVAIIRPGPIVGGMIKPFFDRRQGRAPVEYPHPCLEPILKRTLGVPLFQEQLLRIAMVAANFTGGEAEELRRAMGFKRSMERMAEIETRLRAGMTKNGIGAAAQDQIVKSITSFALYGFPESHAASFALIAYASAYIKTHHPAAFYVALLNAWPMGFYHPATLIKDAQRHRVTILPVDVNRSGWQCRWEDHGVRLGLRYVKGLRAESGERLEAAQPFASPDDLALRARLRDDQITKLAYAGALAPFGLTRRAALWQAAWATKPSGELFEEDRVIPNRRSREAAKESLSIEGDPSQPTLPPARDDTHHRLNRVIPSRRSREAAKESLSIEGDPSQPTLPPARDDIPGSAAVPAARAGETPAFPGGHRWLTDRDPRSLARDDTQHRTNRVIPSRRSREAAQDGEESPSFGGGHSQPTPRPARDDTHHRLNRVIPSRRSREAAKDGEESPSFGGGPSQPTLPPARDDTHHRLNRVIPSRRSREAAKDGEESRAGESLADPPPEIPPVLRCSAAPAVRDDTNLRCSVAPAVRDDTNLRCSAAPAVRDDTNLRCSAAPAVRDDTNLRCSAAPAVRDDTNVEDGGRDARAPRGSPLPEMSDLEETMADYAAMDLTTGRHLLEHYRPQLEREGILSAADLRRAPNGSRVTTAGAVIVRQRPGTAKGFVFLTLEDETGLAQAIVNPRLFSDQRTTILGHSGLIVEGIVQNGEGQPSVRAETFRPLDGIEDIRSHDFH